MKRPLTLLLLSILVAACGNQQPTQPALSVDELMTASIGTMISSYFGTQTAIYTPETATPTSTNTPLPTMTPYPTVTLGAPTATTIVFVPFVATFTPGPPTVTGTLPTPTVNSDALAYGCNNLAFIRDVTVPPGTVMQKDEEFTKTWKVQNTGTCDWLYQYHLVLLSGDDLKASGDFIQRKVTVWDWAELGITFTAPHKGGTYTSYWRMADGDGHMFGSTLIMSIIVND